MRPRRRIPAGRHPAHHRQGQAHEGEHAEQQPAQQGAARFRDEKALGLYKKAKLGNVFRWKLKDLGYSDAFVDKATNAIVTRVAMK